MHIYICTSVNREYPFSEFQVTPTASASAGEYSI